MRRRSILTLALACMFALVGTPLTGPVSTGSTWARVATGAYHTCATQADQSAWCWGYNDKGQLGLGDTTNRNTATQLPGLSAAAVYSGTRASSTFFIE